MLVLWAMPLLGLFLGIAGFVLSLVAFSGERSQMAKAGLFLNSLGFGLALLNLTVSFYLFLAGDIDWQIILDRLS